MPCSLAYLPLRFSLRRLAARQEQRVSALLRVPLPRRCSLVPRGVLCLLTAARRCLCAPVPLCVCQALQLESELQTKLILGWNNVASVAQVHTASLRLSRLLRFRVLSHTHLGSRMCSVLYPRTHSRGLTYNACGVGLLCLALALGVCLTRLLLLLPPAARASCAQGFGVPDFLAPKKSTRNEFWHKNLD